MQDSNYKKCNDIVLHQSTGHALPNVFANDRICATCHRSLHRGAMPAQSVGNGLDLDDPPEQLSQLTALERHIISRRIPFLKLVALPRGKQLAIHGPVVNVPCAPSAILEILLPRLATDTSIIPLKLKRKLSYRGNYLHGNIDTTKVSAALEWLTSNNPLYADITINSCWHKTWADLTARVKRGHYFGRQDNLQCEGG